MRSWFCAMFILVSFNFTSLIFLITVIQLSYIMSVSDRAELVFLQRLQFYLSSVSITAVDHAHSDLMYDYQSAQFRNRLKQIDYASLLLRLKISTLIDQNAKIFEQKIDETAKQLMMNIYDNSIQTFDTEKKWHLIEIIIYAKLVIKSILRLKNRIEAFIHLKHSSSMTEKTSIEEKSASVHRKRTLLQEFTALFNKLWTSTDRRRV